MESKEGHSRDRDAEVRSWLRVGAEVGGAVVRGEKYLWAMTAGMAVAVIVVCVVLVLQFQRIDDLEADLREAKDEHNAYHSNFKQKLGELEGRIYVCEAQGNPQR